jgi:hypothetical protein
MIITRPFAPRYPAQRSSPAALPRPPQWRAAQHSPPIPLRRGDDRAARVYRGDGLGTAGFGKLEGL